jgi:hypothetical protein
MSAVAKQNALYTLTRSRISELDLLRAISQITWTAEQEEAALPAVAGVALRLPGVTGLRFEPDGAGSPHLRVPLYEIAKQRSGLPVAFASSPVSASGQSYGQLRLFIDPHASLPLESPVRLAKFLGQQIGLLLHRLTVRREHQRLTGHLKTIERAIRRRKAIHRAAVILAEQRNISESEAVSFMVRYARRNRRNLLDVSEALIFGFDSSRVPSSRSKASPFHVR